MVESLVQEDEWLDVLESVPVWQPPAKETIVIAPHPDDETLAAGGIIAYQRRRALKVSVVAVTDGEAAYPDFNGLGPLRRIEQQRALTVLGVPGTDIYRLGLPDSNVSAFEPDLACALKSIIHSESIVFAPWTSDWHPDHEACGKVAELVASRAGAQLIYYLFWTWHQRSPDSLAGREVRRFELSQDLLALKEQALSQHASQLFRDSGSPILPEDLLKPARRSFETFILHA